MRQAPKDSSNLVDLGVPNREIENFLRKHEFRPLTALRSDFRTSAPLVILLSESISRMFAHKNPEAPGRIAVLEGEKHFTFPDAPGGHWHMQIAGSVVYYSFSDAATPFPVGGIRYVGPSTPYKIKRPDVLWVGNKEQFYNSFPLISGELAGAEAPKGFRDSAKRKKTG